MTNTELFIGLCGLIGFQVLNGWAQYFLTYMQKSGEYKAIKENIEEVTSQTESIKNDISVLTQNRLSMISEKRTAIFNLFESYNSWFNSIDGFDVFIPKDRTELTKKTEDKYSELNIAHSKFELIVDHDHDFGVAYLDLKTETFKYKQEVITASFNYEKALIAGEKEVKEFRETYNVPIIKQYEIVIAKIGSIRSSLSDMIKELHVPTDPT